MGQDKELPLAFCPCRTEAGISSQSPDGGPECLHIV